MLANASGQMILMCLTLRLHEQARPQALQPAENRGAPCAAFNYLMIDVRCAMDSPLGRRLFLIT